MVEQNFPDNVLYELDNLDVLRGMNSETVDLIATDPPFNTKRNRSGTAGFYVDNWKWGDTGKLPDQWAWNEVHPVWLEQIKDDNPALYEVIEAARACHGEDIAAFLCFLSVRLLECHRVLKPAGSIYLHCDHTASGYIRMAMDAVFGAKNFRNEIVWCYTGPSNTKRWFPRKHDTIFLYTKGDEWTFNSEAVLVAYNEKYVQRFSKQYNERADKSSIFSGGHNTERNQELARQGKVPEDWWPEFSPVGRIASERTGSPDQKPLALYERIILASSNPGDLVLDPFAGCATTIIAARKHNRRWIGIDRRTDARFHVVMRIMNIKAQDAEELRTKRPDLSDYLDSQFARYDAHYRTKAPERTDTGETAAPVLDPVWRPMAYEQPAWQRLNHAEMRDILQRTQRINAQSMDEEKVVCAGCGRVLEPEFMELDHITPKSDRGENYIPNRILLCGPCNQKKANRITLSGLRRENKQSGWMVSEVNAESAFDAARRFTARVRDEWGSPDVQTIIQMVRGT